MQPARWITFPLFFFLFCYLSTQLAGEVTATRQISRQVSSPWGHVQVKSQVFTTSFIFSCWRNLIEIKRSLLVKLISVSRSYSRPSWCSFIYLIFFCLIVKNLSLGCFWYQISSQFKYFVRQASTKWNLRAVGSRWLFLWSLTQVQVWSLQLCADRTVWGKYTAKWHASKYGPREFKVEMV